MRNQHLAGILPKVWRLILALALAAPILATAQNMIIYDGSLTNGWADGGSYTITLNYANTSPLYSGSDSISATITGGYGAMVLYVGDISDTAYASISFWLNGIATGGQHLQMYGVVGYGIQSPRYTLTAPVANTWEEYTVPLSALGVANSTMFTGFAIQDDAGTAEPTFYVADIQLVNASGPALTHLTVNAGQPIRTADARWFGLNTAIWDGDLDTPQTLNLLTSMGTAALRFPGGSDSDDYHWVANQLDNGGYVSSSASLANFIQVITNLNAQAMTTLNYGTGSTNEAAAWVAYVNATTNNTQSLGVDAHGTNWQTAGYWASLRAAAPLGTDDGKNFLRISQTAPLGLKYWEIGNEEYGSWETDSNTVAHDPYTYAVRASGYISLMKAVDPTIKIGVVVTPGEDSYANNTSHPAYNAREGTYHNGWTAVLLATLKSLAVTPDFAIHHRYPENPGSESDAGLLASSTGWASDAADLRQQLSDYMGTNVGSNVELVCTENNSVSSAPGKQSVSLVNGLFKADSLAQLMQTEFNGLFWWDLRNGQETDGNLSSSLYGWRDYGDFGVVDGYSPLYPTYYIEKLMTHFVQAGDTVISAASDYSLLSTYAVRRQDGTLTILTINKDPMNTLTGQVAVASYIPAATGMVYSYGIPQDNAAETGTGSPDLAQTNFSNMGTNFTYAFPPYSATVLVLVPPASSIDYATPGSVYSQNFDSLPDPGATSVNASQPVTINGVTYSLANPYDFAHPVFATGNSGGLGISALAGWYGSSVSNSQFGATDGDQTTGGQISFGLPSSSNRALGLLATSSTEGTAFGARFINGTAMTLNQMNVQFTGEVWRQSNLPKTLQFYYFIDPTGIAAFPGSATALIPALNVSFPTNAADSGGDPVDGTALLNETNLNVSNQSIINWPPGAALWLVWQMTDDTGKAQGLGIDNFSFSASVAPQLVPLNIRISGTNLSVTWPTAMGQSYQLEYNENLNSTSWTPLGNSVSGTGSPATSNIGVTNAQCYFRLAIVP